MIVADTSEERAEGALKDFHKSSQQMGAIPDMRINAEGAEDVEEWLGIELLDRCLRLIDPKKMQEDENKRKSKHANGIEYEDVAMETGCTFKIMAAIPQLSEEPEVNEKIKHMATWTRMRLSALGLPRVPTKEKNSQADLTFGHEQNGEFPMVDEDGNEHELHPPELLEMLADCKKRGGLIIEFQSLKGLRYKLTTKALDEALDRLYKKIIHLAGERRWQSIPPPESHLRNLENQLDEPFLAEYCLIGGMQTKYLTNGKLNGMGAIKINWAVNGGSEADGSGISSKTADDIANGNKNPIRPRSMVWGRVDHDRLTYLVQLKEPIRVGVTMQGGVGVMVYGRVLISSTEDPSRTGIGGEWVTRQYLRDEESVMFMKLEEHGEQSYGQDVVIAGLRGLPRVLELDNALIRAVRKHYTYNMGLSICVMVSTMQHASNSSQSQYFDDLVDEPFLVVILLKTQGGASIRRTWKEANRYGSTGELKIGSINLTTCMELRDIQGKSLTYSGRIMDIDARALGTQSTDIGRIINELGVNNMEKIELLVKASSGNDKWIALLKKSYGTEDRYDSGVLTIKEKNIPKPKDRQGSNTRGLDFGNLEPLEYVGKIGNSNVVVERVVSNQGYQGKHPQASYKGKGGSQNYDTHQTRYSSSSKSQHEERQGQSNQGWSSEPNQKRKSRSRSASRDRDQRQENSTIFNVSEIKGLYKTQAFSRSTSVRDCAINPSSSNRDPEEGEIREEIGSRPKTRFAHEPKERIMKEAKPENK